MYVTQYPINTAPMLSIWTMICLIPPIDVELVGGRSHKMDKYYPPCFYAFLTENLILTHYMITAWWKKRLDGLENYITHPGATEKLVVMRKTWITWATPIPVVGSRILQKFLEFLRDSDILRIPEGGTGCQGILWYYLEPTLKKSQQNLIPQQDIRSGTKGSLTPSTLTSTYTLSATP